MNNHREVLKPYSFGLIINVYIPLLELLVFRNQKQMAQAGREHETV
jgi:hypothetical protein